MPNSDLHSPARFQCSILNMEVSGERYQLSFRALHTNEAKPHNSVDSSRPAASNFRPALQKVFDSMGVARVLAGPKLQATCGAAGWFKMALCKLTSLLETPRDQFVQAMVVVLAYTAQETRFSQGPYGRRSCVAARYTTLPTRLSRISPGI
jgi:hypothetical protein